MKIVDNEANLIQYKDVPVGAIFKCGGEVFIKIERLFIFDDDDVEDTVTAINLKNTEGRSFFENDPVEYLENAKLILY